MTKYELQKLRDLPIEGVAERLGLRVERHKCLCPFHDDHHASLSFSASRNTYRCFACGASGGVIDLAMALLPLGGGREGSFLDACKWLADGAALAITSYRDNDITTKKEPPFDASRYARFFEHPWLSPEACKFLFEERRLDEHVVRWCRLTSWRDKRGVSWLQIPYYDRDGKLVGIQNRNLQTPSNSHSRGRNPGEGSLPQEGEAWRGSVPRFRFPQGSECGIYNLPVLNLLKPGEALYIAEGCSDCWSLLSAGHKAIAIPSATLLSKKDVEQLSIVNSQLSITFHMYPDRDAPGERLFLQLQEVLPGLVHHQLPQGCKDYSEYYLKMKTPLPHLGGEKL